LFGEVRVFHRPRPSPATDKGAVASTDLFRGEILGLSGGADFYGSNPEELRQEFKRSLDIFLEVCKERGIEPRKQFSGQFNLRIPPDLQKSLR
jgi:predicted HicB family RNase H-like nuclease